MGQEKFAHEIRGREFNEGRHYDLELGGKKEWEKFKTVLAKKGFEQNIHPGWVVLSTYNLFAEISGRKQKQNSEDECRRLSRNVSWNDLSSYGNAIKQIIEGVHAHEQQ